MPQMIYELDHAHLATVGDPALGLHACTICGSELPAEDLSFDIPSATLACDKHTSEAFMAACDQRLSDAVYRRTPADKAAAAAL